MAVKRYKLNWRSWIVLGIASVVLVATISIHASSHTTEYFAKPQFQEVNRNSPNVDREVTPVSSPSSSTTIQGSTTSTSVSTHHAGSHPENVSPPIIVTPPITSTPQLPPVVLLPTTPIPIAPSVYGVSLGGTLGPLSATELEKRLDDISTSGISWVRIDIGWDQIEPREGTFRWSRLDMIISEITERKLKILAVLAYSPSWARHLNCPIPECPPRDPSEYARFAGAVAARYATKGVSSFEIWNEPNIGLFWYPSPDPESYTSVLMSAHAAIIEANPNATVITGGLSPSNTSGGNFSPYDFLTAIYHSGGKDAFEAVGHHPYSFPATPNYTQKWNAWSQMDDTSNSLRSVMAANGDSSKKIWMTEFGAPTGGPENLATIGNYKSITNSDHVTEELQAEMLKQAFSLAQTYSWAGPLFWYSYKDLGEDEGDNENFFGIIRYDGSHKPAYDALRSMLGTN